MKKVAGLLLTLLLMLCFVFAVPVSANAASADTQCGLQASIVTDKNEYKADEEIEAIFTITNTNDYKVEGVTVEPKLSDGLFLDSSDLTNKAIALESEESYSAKMLLSTKKDLVDDTSKDDKTDNKKDNSKSPKTNDTSKVVLWIVFFVISAVCIFVCIKYRKSVKVLSVILCIAMAVSMAPLSAFAAETEVDSFEIDKTITVDKKEYSISMNISVPNVDDSVYVVTFDTVGGSAIEPVTVEKGSTVTVPELPTRENYLFVGWYVDADYSEQFDFDLPINSSCTVYARWVDISDATDTDKDGLTDPVEEFYGTNISNPDTDADGLSDYIEIAVLNYDPLKDDSDNDGTLDGLEDYDEDGINNIDEINIGTDPALVDTDGDELEDKAEIDTHKTDPALDDTDGDGASDGKEVEIGSNPLVAESEFIVDYSNSNTEDTVTPSVEINLSGEQVDTLSIDPFEDDNFFPETMPGYMGKAYDFSVDGEFEEATISFEFDESVLSEESDPIICYFNEEAQELEELKTTINGNRASATVEHFSKYILIDRKIYNDSFTWTDVWDSNHNYSDVEIVFVIDDSGSMDWNDPSYERLNVARNLIDDLPTNSKIGLVRFDGDWPKTEALTKTLTTNKEEVKNYLTRTYFYSPGNTDMYNGIQKAFPLYESTESTTLKIMIVLSDGETDDTYLHSSVVNTANDSNIRIYTVGLGSDTYYFNEYLNPLAVNTGGAFYLANNADELAEIYKQIGEKIDIETDGDHDGIPDYYEDNMLCFNGVKLALDKDNPDTDGDGIEDGKEVEIKFEYNADKTKVKVTGKLVKGNPIELDSDGDGYIDSKDKHPLKWDVSDRDLAMFAALTYEPYTKYDYKNVDDNYYFLSYASANEVYEYWDIVDSSGEVWADIATHFYATTYKNANNIVISYRGTDSEWGEWVNNIVGVGLINYHSEEGYAVRYAKRIAKLYPNCNIYITGHSLGGYLAQFGASEIILNHNKNKLKKVAYFNGIGLKYNKLLWWTKNDVMDSLKDYYNEDVSNPNLISYNIYGDVVSALGTHSGAVIGFLATEDAINQHRGKYGSGGLTDFLSKSAAGWLTILSSENIAYYYNYYNSLSVKEYFWVTHETDSFFNYLTAGTRNSK